MRLLVDAASAEFGGIRTYVEQLLGRWSDLFPEDRLTVVVAAGSTIDSAGHARHELRSGRPGVVTRPLAQTRALPRLARELDVEAVLATNPTTSLRRPGRPLAVVVHDLRHELRPAQFSRGRRLLRWAAYRRSYALADGFVAVSRRTLDDLHRLHPGTARRPGTVVHHGADHVLSWPAPDRSGPAVAFGHHTNKNPELVLDAWAVLARDGDDPGGLVLLGLPSGARPAMADRVRSLGLGEWVELAPFLPESDFRAMLARAELVVFPSDLEGFGLPVVEGMTLGKPVVVAPDEGTAEIAAGHASTATDWSPQALADAVRRARLMTPDEVEAARAHGRTFTWERAVQQTRGFLERLVDGAAR